MSLPCAWTEHFWAAGRLEAKAKVNVRRALGRTIIEWLSTQWRGMQCQLHFESYLGNGSCPTASEMRMRMRLRHRWTDPQLGGVRVLKGRVALSTPRNGSQAYRSVARGYSDESSCDGNARASGCISNVACDECSAQGNSSSDGYVRTFVSCTHSSCKDG